MTVVSISADEVEETRDFMSDDSIGYPMALDREGTTIKAWGLTEEGEDRSVPAVFLVDRDGVIRFAQVGDSISDRADLDQLLDVIDRR